MNLFILGILLIAAIYPNEVQGEWGYDISLLQSRGCLNVTPRGPNVKSIWSYCESPGVDCTHEVVCGWCKPHCVKNRRSYCDYSLVTGGYYGGGCHCQTINSAMYPTF